MKLNFKFYMLFPLLVLALAFVVDKQFYIGGYQDYFLRTASFINYNQKEDLIEEMYYYLRQPERRKVLVILGSSRSMSFDNSYLEKKFPGWTLFNFSVPGGNSDYYLYFMERFRKRFQNEKTRGLKPDFVYFVVSPQGYNDAVQSLDEVLLNGLSASFIARHAGLYGVDAVNNYIAKKMFWNYQFRPKLSVVLKKLKDNKLHYRGYKKLRALTYHTLTENRGSVPYTGIYRNPAQNDEFLVQNARKSFDAFFKPFSVSPAQIYFTAEYMKIAKELNIPARLLWARVGPELRRLKKEEPVRGPSRAGKPDTVYNIWTPPMKKIARKYNSELVDMNFGPTIACDRYYDASHLAGACIEEYTDFLMEIVLKEYKQR